MARIRSLKPEFWTDSKVVRLSAFARLLFQGMWNFAICDQGHLDDDAFALKLKVLPADPVDATDLLNEVIGSGMVVRREMQDGRTYLHVVHLSDHSKVDNRWSTRCPYCAHENSHPPGETPAASPSLTETHASLPEPQPNSSQGGLGLGLGGGEGEVRGGSSPEPAASRGRPSAPEPPLGCKQHPNGTDQPCGPCKDARRRHESWHSRQRDRPTPTPSTPECPLHPGQPTGSKSCPRCAAGAATGPPTDLRATLRNRSTA